MVVVAINCLDPLGDEGGGRLLVVRRVGRAVDGTPVAEFTPDEVAQAIGVEVVALLEHLLMKAGAVESGIHGELDVSHKCFVGRGSHETVRPETLIEYEALEDRLPIQQDAISMNRDRTQPRVRRDLIDDLVALAEGGDDVVEMRVAG